jgi:ligand-binding SRPBCC domain-containing protein
VAIVEVVTTIAAPRKRCFDLARDIDLHLKSMQKSGERAVAGTTSGLIGPGEEVTWEARHFGVRQRFTSRITAFEEPSYFQDSMVRGAFSHFIHDHRFESEGGRTVMRDLLRFRSPLGPFAILFDRLVLGPYLKRLLEVRAAAIKEEAERGSSPTLAGD